MSLSNRKPGRPKAFANIHPDKGSAGEVKLVRCSSKRHKGVFQRRSHDDLSETPCPICLKVGTLKPIAS